MSQMDYSHNNRSKRELEKIQSSNTSRQNLKKSPYLVSSSRAISARPNQLPKILKDYQQFCEKHFNSNTTFAQASSGYNQQQSFSMSNHYPQTQSQSQSQSPIIDTSNIPLSFIDNGAYDFISNPFLPNDIFNKLELRQDAKKSLGYEKNDKNDYEQRLRRITMPKGNEYNGNEANGDADKYEEEEFNFKDELEVDKQNKGFKNDVNINDDDESNEHEKNIIEKDNESNDNDNRKEGNEDGVNAGQPMKIFDESTHKIIDQEMRNQYATKIQIYYKTQKDHKRGRDRLYVDYDKSGRYIVFVYIDKIDQNGIRASDDYDIEALMFKVFSFETHAVTYNRKEVRELYTDSVISSRVIGKVIVEMIEKVVKYDKEKNAKERERKEKERDKEEEESAYDDDFEDIMHSDKIMNNDIHQSISSIDKVDYDNI